MVTKEKPALAFRIDPALKDALIAAARDDGRSLSGYVTYTLRAAVLRSGHLDSDGKVVAPKRGSRP